MPTLAFNIVKGISYSMQNKSEQITTLIELNQELENYFRNTIIPQLFVDAHLILRKFTPPAMKQFNLTEKDLGRSIADIKENFRFPTIIENIQHVIDTGEILEKEIQTNDFRWYQMNVLPYYIGESNRTNGVIITFVEITMRIKDLKEQENVVADYEMLLDSISHDIKTPLTTLSLSVQLLKKVPEKGMEKFPFLLENVENSLHKIQQIIIDLTNSRWDKHRYQAVEELLNIEHIIEDVRLTLAQQIKECNATIKSEITRSQLVFVRRKVRSVLYNLVNNAIKYRAEGRKPEITIKTGEEDGFFTMTVIDNGVGIAKKDLKSIFLKYQRLTNSVEGNGIGLYLVKEIIINAGGKITAESEFGQGSVFKVFFKLKQKVKD